MRSVVAAVVLVLALPATAQAEIFKCVGPNGDVRFTSSAAQCPNATPHAPKEGAVQRVEKSAAPLASARPGAAAGARRASTPAAQGTEVGDAAAEAIWRNKKRVAESDASTLEASLARMREALRWCDKGAEVSDQDPRTGMWRRVRCKDIYTEHKRLEAELKKARSYLEVGLEDECRQAGCLPGWIR